MKSKKRDFRPKQCACTFRAELGNEKQQQIIIAMIMMISPIETKKKKKDEEKNNTIQFMLFGGKPVVFDSVVMKINKMNEKKTHHFYIFQSPIKSN